MNDEIVMEVRNLKKYFPIKAGMFGRVVGQVRAVDGVSFHIRRGTTMGLVGESGCGKTTIGKTLLRLNDKTSGDVLFKGQRTIRSLQARIAQDSSAVADHFPGPVFEPVSAYAGRRDHRRSGARAQAGAGIGARAITSPRSCAPAASSRITRIAIRTSFPADSGRESASPARWRSTRISSCATSRFPRWTCRFRRRSSTCWKTCKAIFVDLSVYFARSVGCGAFPTRSASCTLATWWNTETRRTSSQSRCIPIRKRCFRRFRCLTLR